MKALLIVDLQNDFLPGGALGIPESDQVIPFINKWQKAFPLVVASKDWHPPHHISFASRHKKKVGESIIVEGFRQELWPDHCVQDTWGAEFSPLLHTERISHVFCKGVQPEIDSYSAFFDNNRLHTTGLAEYLKGAGVKALYIVGLATNFCVKFSTFDALDLGFECYILEKGCKGIDLQPGDTVRAIQEMERRGAFIF